MTVIYIDDSGQTVIDKPDMKKWVVVHKEFTESIGIEKIWVTRAYD